MQQKYELRFISDPGHGWLEVPMALLRDLGIDKKITNCSYIHKGMAYLEEDCDYGTFVCTARDVIELTIVEEHQEITPIRDYRRFSDNYSFMDDEAMVRRVFG